MRTLLGLVILCCLCGTAFAAGNASTIHAGIFTISVDPGHPFNYSVSEPIEIDSLGGNEGIGYLIDIENETLIAPAKYENSIYDPKRQTVDADTIKREMTNVGVDKDSIYVTERKIDGTQGAVGSGVMKEGGSKFYYAGYIISSKSICWITGYDLGEMVSVLKTIHVTDT